jgi:peroxiredoxin
MTAFRRGSATTRRIAGLVLAVTAMAGLSACTNDPLAEQYRAGDGKGFVAGDFATAEIPADERAEPVSFTAETETGATVSSADYAGEVYVVNFWYAACAPCRVEAPRLEEALADLAGEDVSFLGVNTYDQAPTAASFATEYGLSYPSVIDVDDKTVTLAFARAIPVSATPTTLVVDRQGRVAARIIGELPDASILTTIVRDLVAEPA